MLWDAVKASGDASPDRISPGSAARASRPLFAKSSSSFSRSASGSGVSQFIVTSGFLCAAEVLSAAAHRFKDGLVVGMVETEADTAKVSRRDARSRETGRRRPRQTGRV
jgi:hypothetical protein